MLLYGQKCGENKIWLIAPYSYVQKLGQILIWQVGRWCEIIFEIVAASMISKKFDRI